MTMVPPSATLVPPTEVPNDDDFVLDMRIVEATTPLVTGRCDTSDGCGDTCNTSACSTSSYDPA
jgi:FxLD family lantipeptide